MNTTTKSTLARTSVNQFKSVIFTALLLLCSTAALAAPKHFSVDVQGEGPVMVLVPGLNTPGEVWNTTVAEFSSRYQTHTLTIHGFSATHPLKTDQQAPELAAVKDDIIAYIKDKKLNPTVVVGHSLGGFLGMWVAADEPVLLQSLVLIDSLPFFSAVTNPAATSENMKASAAQMKTQILANTDLSVREPFAKQMAVGMTQNPEYHERLVQWSLNADPKMTAQAMHDMSIVDLRQNVSEITAPTLVLGAWIEYQKFGATKEQVKFNFENQYAAHNNKEIILSDSAKHFIMLDEPEWTNEQIGNFLLKNK